MKRKTKYRLIAGIITGSIVINGGISLLTNFFNIKKLSENNIKNKVKTQQIINYNRDNSENLLNSFQSIYQESTEEYPSQDLEKFLKEIDDKQVKKFYTKLYELYNFETFNGRSAIPQYFQTIYGNKFSCGTIQSAGCGISSLAMITSYLYGEIITPDMMTIYDSGPSPAVAFEKGIKRLNLNCEKYYGQNAIDNLDKALESGHPLIALYGKSSLFTDNGHFIVISQKTTDGHYIVNDPNIENYYKPQMINGYTNGFTRDEIIKGLRGIYIFDTKESFKDMRNSKLLLANTKSQSLTTKEVEIEGINIPYIKHNDIVITLEKIPLYKRPTEVSEKIYYIEKNTELEVIALTENDYLAVYYNNNVFYIKTTKIKSVLENIQSLYPEVQLTDLIIHKIAYINTEINLRCGNSIEFDAIDLLKKYETIRIIEEYNDWYFVITNEQKIGFIPKKYTNIIEEEIVVADKSTQKVYYYKDNKLVYSTPKININSTSNDGIYPIISKGNEFIIINPSSNWKNFFYTTDQNKTLQKIYREIEKGDKIIIHN